MLSWSSAAWNSSWRLAAEIGGGNGGRSEVRLVSGEGLDWVCGSGRTGEQVWSGNFHWVKLWEVEEEEDSESGCEGR